MIHPLAHFAVMVEKPQPPFMLHDRMMSRPAENGIENSAPICKWTIWRGPSGIGQEVSITRRIGEIVHVVSLVDPRRFEESALVVICQDRLPSLVDDLNLLHRLAKGMIIVRKSSYPWTESYDFFARRFMRSVQGGIESVAGRRVVALQLTTPNTAKVAVDGSVVIGKSGRVDRKAVEDVRLVGCERPFWFVTDGNA